MKGWIETEASNLIALVDRFKTTYWPDWEEMCSSLELNTHLPKKEVPADQAEQKADDEESKKKKVIIIIIIQNKCHSLFIINNDSPLFL